MRPFALQRKLPLTDVGRFQVLGLKDVAVVYVESFARVRSLSLTGKLLYPFVDRFIVQWPYLEAKYPKAEFKGRLV